MREKHSTLRALVHGICARPHVICWVIGTLAFWISITDQFYRAGVLGLLTTDWAILTMVIVGYAGTSGLGFLVCVLFGSGVVVSLCRRVNGAPHEVGERVMILSGPRSGTRAPVYEIWAGQGRRSLLRVDLDEKARAEFRDVYEEYELLRIPDKQSSLPVA